MKKHTDFYVQKPMFSTLLIRIKNISNFYHGLKIKNKTVCKPIKVKAIINSMKHKITIWLQPK